MVFIVMASFEREYVMFLVGRMNPPTPGHIRGLCIPFLRALREKCIEIIGEGVSKKGHSLFELTRLASIAPRFFLTNTTNEKRISYLSETKRALYDNIKQIVEKETTDAQMDQGIFYVKDKQLENPLDPELKKEYVIKMLGNELQLSENKDIKVPTSILKLWIVCQTTGVESWCAAYGPASAIRCAIMLNKPKSYDNVFFFMGNDEDPSEMAGRSKFCKGNDAENEEGAKVNCVILKRINNVAVAPAPADAATAVAPAPAPATAVAPAPAPAPADAAPADADAAPADAAESIADGSMSASKIRLLCANGDVATLHLLYVGLLEPKNVDALINDVRIGLRLPVIDLINATRPSDISRTSGRIHGSMPGPGLQFDRRNGRNAIQSTPGSHLGLSSLQKVDNAEAKAMKLDRLLTLRAALGEPVRPETSTLETIPEASQEEEKEGGRRKTRRICRRNATKTRRRKPRTKTARRKPKRIGSRKKNTRHRRYRS